MFSSRPLSAILVAAILCNHGYTKSVPLKRHSRDADLSRAIQILQEQRDRLQEEDFRRLAESGIDLQALGLLDGDDVENEPLWLSDSLADQEIPEDIPIDEDIPIPEAESVPGNDDVVETSSEELENIFDDNGDPEAKITKTEEIIEEEMPSNESETDGNSGEESKLSDDEYQALLRAVEKLQKNSEESDKPNELENMKKKRTPKEVVKVSKEELNDVFGEHQDDSNNNDSDKTNRNSEPDVLKRSQPSTANIEETLPLDDYWLLNNYLNYDDSRKKRFIPERVPMVDESETDEFNGDRDAMMAEIERLRLVNHLEDLENEALTEALNQATQSQEEGSVSPKEFKSLEKAIKIEEALQTLNPSEEQLAFIVQALANDVLKRAEPDFKKKRMDTGDMDTGYPVYSEESAARKRSGYRDDQGLWYDFSAKDKRSNIQSQDLLDYLESQVEGNQDNEENEDIENDETGIVPYISDDTQEMCPEVESFSDGCAFADYYGLPIDKEARELCNRYQICNTCGSSFGLTSDWCDNTYREVYSSLCEENSECVIEAELFLRTMKLKRRFITQQICMDQCTAEYIGIV